MDEGSPSFPFSQRLCDLSCEVGRACHCKKRRNALGFVKHPSLEFAKYSGGSYNMARILTSSFLKCNLAVIKMLRRHLNSFGVPSYPFTHICFSKHKIEAQFLNGIF